MSVSQAQVNFLDASQFAVIGRVLTDRSRWDNKVRTKPLLYNLSVVAVRASVEGRNGLRGGG